MKKKEQKKTTSNKNNTYKRNKVSKKSKTINKYNTSNKNINENSSNITRKNNSTSNTTKMTFYVKKDLLEKLYNFAYWDRHKITEAFNKVLADGLKGKTTKPVKR